MLPSEVTPYIHDYVRAGFEDRLVILDIIVDEVFYEIELDREAVLPAIDHEFARVRMEQKLWPKVTDFDRLDRTFRSLRDLGVIAVHKAGITTSDGTEICEYEYSRTPDPKSIVGFCYYHWQDVKRAIHSGGLYIGFGFFDVKREKTEGPKVGTLVKTELERAGFSVQWNGTMSQRIYIPNFIWQRRV